MKPLFISLLLLCFINCKAQDADSAYLKNYVGSTVIWDVDTALKSDTVKVIMLVTDNITTRKIEGYIVYDYANNRELYLDINKKRLPKGTVVWRFINDDK